MATYTHTLNKRKALLAVILDEEQQGDQTIQDKRSLLPVTAQKAAQEVLPDQSLPPSQDDDEFSWYEE
jgi:hypothetical protein